MSITTIKRFLGKSAPDELRVFRIDEVRGYINTIVVTTMDGMRHHLCPEELAIIGIPNTENECKILHNKIEKLILTQSVNKEIDVKIDVFKQTSDNWFPSYELAQQDNNTKQQKLVKVSFTQTGPKPPIDGKWRVCVWGKDDYGMERDFISRSEAWCCFLELLELNDITVNALKERRFLIA